MSGGLMRVGLHISDFTWDGGAAELGPRLGAIARRAEQGGVDRISVMDHVWQIRLYDLAEAGRKLDILRQHCAAEGRDYDTIEKTGQFRYNLGENGENVQQTIEYLHQAAELGFSQVHGSLIGVSEPGQLDLLAEQVIPAVAKF
jgi:hypothetical protein